MGDELTSSGAGCMMGGSLHALQRLREDGLLCDAVLRTSDGAAFPVHRAILSASSPYFLALFTRLLHTEEESDVTLNDVKSEILEYLIEYAYLRKVTITNDNVHDLLVTADYLSFLDVLQLCCDYLRISLKPDNCLGTMLFARNYFCKDLERDSRRYTLRHFVAVSIESLEFLDLPFEELQALLADDELNVRSEETAWDATLRWVYHDPYHRKKHFVALMSCIRLGLIDMQVFLEKIKTHPFVVENNASRPIVIETLKFLYNLETIDQQVAEIPTPKLARPRVPHEVLFSMGGWSGGSPTSFIETYDTKADRWISVEEIDPGGPRAYHGTAVLGFSIYIIGGFDGSDYFNSCRCFDAVLKTWKEIAPMNARRCYVSVTSLGEEIYAMGGYDGHQRQKTVEKYCWMTNQWSLVAPMNSQRSDASACTLNNKIYITGGFNGQDCMSSVEMYDPETNQWTNIASMASRRSGVSCVSFQNKIYVLGGFNGVSRMASGEVFEPLTGSWSPLPDMYNQRSNFAIEVIDDMIFAIGGFNGVTTTCHVECYDATKNQWYEATDMLLCRSALSASVIMGLPNVRDYIYHNREGLMEEKRKMIAATTTRLPSTRTHVADFQPIEEIDEDPGHIEDDNMQTL